MGRILIAGCGYVGTRLGTHLQEQGDEVHALRRHIDALPSDLLPLQADLSNPGTLKDLPSVDTVFYTAAAGGSDVDAYKKAYVDGLKNLLANLKSMPKNLIYLSSTRVYGEHQGAWVNEDTNPNPLDEQAQLLLAGENIVDQAELSGYVLRLGGIYGPGRDFLIRHLKNNHENMSASTQTFTNRIHVDDIVQICAAFLKRNMASGIYLGVDSEPASQADVYLWLAKELGLKAPAATAEKTGSAQRGNKRCSNQKLRDAGFKFRYPTFREGYGEMLKASRS
jgi:nucleoside-diphosphate-sugar epimerase